MERIAEAIINNAKALAIIILIATISAIAYLAVHGIRIDHSLESFLAETDQAIQQFREFTDKYEPDDQVTLVAFKVDDLFTPEVVNDISDISSAIEDMPEVDRVLSLTTFQAPIQTEDGLEVLEILGPADFALANAIQRDSVRKKVLSDSMAVGTIVSADGTTAAFFVTLAGKQSDYDVRKVVLDGIDTALLPYSDKYDFRFSGIPHLRNNYVDMIKVETVKYILLTTVIIVLVLIWMFRSLFAVVLPQTIVYMGTLYTITAMMLLGGALDILTSSMAAIILVVGVADSMHLLSRYQLNRHKGMDKIDAIRDMIIKLGSATFFTSATTAIGFATLFTSNIIPLQRFGLYTALGVLLTFVISVLIIPCGLLLWDKKDFAMKSKPKLEFASGFDRVTDFTRERRWSVIAFSFLLAGVGLWAVFNLRININVNDDLGPRTQVYQDMEFFQENIVSPFLLEMVLKSDESDFFKDPDILSQVEGLQNFVESRSYISGSKSIVDIIKRINQVFDQDGQGQFEIPDSQELVSQYLLLLELSGDDQVERLASLDYDEIRVSVQMDDIGSYEFNDFQAAIDDYGEANLDSRIEIQKTGTPVLATTIGGEISRSLVLSIGLAFLFISIGMAFAFASPKLLVISLVPNVLPLLLAALTMVLMGIDLKPATAIIFTIAFGIAVDDTIHFLARYRQELKDGRATNDAIRNTLKGTGRAIILTSIVIFAGYMVLTTSTFQSLVYMGGLVAVTILYALFSDLVLLPALLAEK